MCAPGNIHRYPVFQGEMTAYNGALGNPELPVYEFGAPGEAHFPHVPGGQPAFLQGPEIGRIMGPQDIIFKGHYRFKKVFGRAGTFVQELLGKQLVFMHGKTMPLGQGVFVNGMVGDFKQGQVYWEFAGSIPGITEKLPTAYASPLTIPETNTLRRSSP